MISVLDTIDGLESIREEWRRLEVNSSLRVFQTFDWNFCGWIHFVSKDPKARLQVLKWSKIDGGGECVIFPLFIDGAGTLRFIMDTHSDVLDAVYLSGHNHHYAFQEAWEWILMNDAVKRVHFQKLCGEGEALNYFGVLIPGCVVYRDNAFSMLKIKRTNDLVNALPMRRKDRSRIKALVKKGDNYCYRVVSSSNGDGFPRDEILKLRTRMLSETKRKIGFLPDDLIEFIRDVYNRGGCEIATFSNSEGVQALAFRLLKRDRINFWIFMYADSKLPTALYVRYMMDRASLQDHLFDFGVGAYGYKLQTFRPETAVTFSLRWGKSFWWQIHSFGGMNWRLLKDYLKTFRKGGH